MKPAFDLESVERAAKGRDVVALVVRYRGRVDPVEYPWADRKKIRWANVCRVSFKLATAKWIQYDEFGSVRHCERVRVRVRGK